MWLIKEGAEDSSIKKSDIEESGENNRTLIENDPGMYWRIFKNFLLSIPRYF